MNSIEANKKLMEACNLIFEVESQFKEGGYPRRMGFDARVKLAEFMNVLREKFPLTNRETVIG